MLLVSAVTNVMAETTVSIDSQSSDSAADTTKRFVKSGWNLGILPSLAYDADNGFTFGVLANVFDYGSGDDYPNYRQRYNVKATLSTKRTGTLRVYYDSDCAIKNHKIAIDLSYITDPISDFYGFNGNQSVFNKKWIEQKSSDYITRPFYMRKTNIFRTSFDINGKIHGNWNWNAGVGILNISEDHVEDGFFKDSYDTVPDLIELYWQWNIISEAERNGGWHPFIHGGFVYDSRPCRVNPPKGIYADLFLTYNAAFGKLKDYNNVVVNFNFMHYVTIVRDYLVFAYHVGGQNVIIGNAPYYLQNYENRLFVDKDRYYGLGGGTTLRGVLRNKIWVPGFAYANIEFRTVFWNFKLFNQYFSLGANLFLDAGVATQKYYLNERDIKSAFDAQHSDSQSWLAKSGRTFDEFFDFDANLYNPHFSAGLGIKIAMNHNFVLSGEWGAPFNEQDSKSMANFYLDLGYLF